MTTGVLANEKENINSVGEGKIVVSEADIISLWTGSSDLELEQIGYTEEQIKEIRSYNFEELFLERASLPTHELVNYGYSAEQIRILKSYDGSTITEDNPILLAASDVTMLFVNSTGTSNSSNIFVNLYWEWSTIPLIKLTDTLAVAFKGVNTSGQYVDATPVTRSAKVKYYTLTSGIYSHTTTISGAYESTKNAVTVTIPMTQSDNYYWAKAGTLELKFTGTSMSYVNLGAAYGHKTLSGTVSISVSNSLSIDFTPALIVSTSGSISGRVTSSGSVSNY